MYLNTESGLKIACAQIDVIYGDVNGTVAKVCRWIAGAASEGADVVLFPELVLSAGYALAERYKTIAEPIDGPSIRTVAEAAKRHRVNVIVGFAERAVHGPYDSAILIDRNGRVTGKYRKSHIYPPTESIFSPGEELPVYKTELGKVGLLICYDLEFPEPARILALQGAEMIFHLVADWPQGVPGTPETIFDLTFRTRALENRIAVASCNRVGEDPDLNSRFYGLSRIVGPTGEVLASADDKEKMISAQIDLDQIRTERHSYDYFSNRRPELYHPISNRRMRGPK